MNSPVLLSSVKEPKAGGVTTENTILSPSASLANNVPDDSPWLATIILLDNNSGASFTLVTLKLSVVVAVELPSET